MSKMGNFVLDMQTDAIEMSLQEFVDRYGNHNTYIWNQARYGDDRYYEPDYEPLEMDDGA